MADASYDDDFYAWTQAQAEALRRRGAGGNALDWDNLAEEIEDVGISERRACESYVEQILIHFLKIAFFGATVSVEHWRAEIAAFRAGLDRRLTPSLRTKLPDELQGIFTEARLRLLADATGRSEVRPVIPETCPYSWDDILGRGDGWTPSPRAE